MFVHPTGNHFGESIATPINYRGVQQNSRVYPAKVDGSVPGSKFLLVPVWKRLWLCIYCLGILSSIHFENAYWWRQRSGTDTTTIDNSNSSKWSNNETDGADDGVTLSDGDAVQLSELFSIIVAFTAAVVVVLAGAKLTCVIEYECSGVYNDYNNFLFNSIAPVIRCVVVVVAAV